MDELINIALNKEQVKAMQLAALEQASMMDSAINIENVSDETRMHAQQLTELYKSCVVAFDVWDQGLLKQWESYETMSVDLEFNNNVIDLNEARERRDERESNAESKQEEPDLQ